MMQGGVVYLDADRNMSSSGSIHTSSSRSTHRGPSREASPSSSALRCQCPARPLEEAIPEALPWYGVRELLDKLSRSREFLFGLWLAVHRAVQSAQAGM
jgi:hypothetical protein